MKFSPVDRKKILLSLVTWIFFLLLIETSARLIINNDWFLTTTPRLSETLWRLEWKKFHHDPHSNFYPIDSYHPLLGWSPRKNIKSKAFDKSIVSFNLDGIRGKKNYERKKPPNTIRIVVVGDSFSFGSDVNDEQTYSAQLERIWPGTEVLNLAVHGYGIDQMYMRLNIDGFNYNPDIVIYAFVYDDLVRPSLGFRDYMKPKYILSNGQLRLTNVPVVPPEKFLRDLSYRPATLDLFSLLQDRIFFYFNRNEVDEALVRAIWTKTTGDIRKHQAIPVFLYLSTGPEMVNAQKNPLYVEKFMFSFCSTMKINCFSTRPYLAQAYQHGVKYDLSSHYESKAHSIIAEGLLADLKKMYKKNQ